MFAKLSPDGVQQESTGGAPGVAPEVQKQMAMLGQITSESMSPTKMQNLSALIDGAKSKADLDKLFGISS